MRVLLLVSLFVLLRQVSAPQPGPANLADFKLTGVLELKGATHHVQGIDFDSRNLWVTSVDTVARKGWLHEFSLATGEMTRQVEIGDAKRFHPGGIQADGDSLWIPVAEYRPKTSAVIQKRSKRTLELEFQFEVADHIGCIAATPEFLVGGNWDSKEFYFWDRRGKPIRQLASTTGNAYQDMKFDSGQIIASGNLADHTGAIDWLELPSLNMARRLAAGKNDRGILYTREGMAIRGSRLMLLPEDDASRLFIFDLSGWTARRDK